MTESACRPSRRLLVAGLIVAGSTAVLSALTIWGRFSAYDPLLRLDIGAGVLATVLAPILLRRPVGGTLVLTVLAALSPAATPQATVGALFVARSQRFRVTVAVAVAGVAAHAIQGLWRPPGGLSYGWWLALIAAAYAALVGWGSLSRSNRALMDSLRDRARRAEEEQGRRVAEARRQERNRIAREMHDVLAHRLSLLATYAGALEYRPDASPEKLTRAAAIVRDGAHQALDDLREVITLLRDDDATDDGDRPQPVLADLPHLLDESRAAGVHVDLHNRLSTSDEVPSAIGRTAYRVVQEAVTNARRHAPGQSVRVELDGHPGARLAIDIRNPVTGPPPPTAGAGTGLIGLAERVQLAGGEFGHRETEHEFHVHAWLPWPS